MVHIKITRGLDIPIEGQPIGLPSLLKHSPDHISLNLQSFDQVKFKVLVQVGESVKTGQPLAEDKDHPGRMFCSPASGTVKEVRRGYRRVLTDIIIAADSNEEYHAFPKFLSSDAVREPLIDLLKAGGIFTRIHNRPFNQLANPSKIPRSIFVKAVESAPFIPSAEWQVAGYEREFQIGLDALAKLTSGDVHLVHRLNSSCRAFTEAKNVTMHTVEGPHPAGNVSVHIEQIDPIRSAQDSVWTLNAHTVVAIGYLLSTGKVYTRRVIGIAGPGVQSECTGFFETREGVPISLLLSGRVQKEIHPRFISGDPLMGHQVKAEDFLGFNDFAFCIIPEQMERQFLHFFRLGVDKYSFSRAYLSGHLDNADRTYSFTTSQHGEHRAFVDSTLYDKVMPLPLSTMLLVKAVMAEDFELAEKLGLLSVDSEDFALPTFVCPSKMEMTEIMKVGLRRYASESLS